MALLEKNLPTLTLVTDEHNSPLSKIFSDCCLALRDFMLQMKHDDDCAAEK